MFIAALLIIAKKLRRNQISINFLTVYSFNRILPLVEKKNPKTIVAPNIIGECHKYNVKQK